MLAPGSKLGRWVIGRLLGEGACGKVYEIENGKDLAGFKCVVKVIPLASGKGKELKEKQNLVNTLNHENTMYQGACLQFKYRVRLPQNYYGDDQTHQVRFMVMERLDRDLVSLAKGKPKVVPTQISEIGLQILDGLKFLHSIGFLFVDVKPDNFMLKEDGKSLCFVDFGCAERWLSYNGAGHREQVGTCPPVGTPNFVSIAMQKGMQPTRIDDCECMCYVLMSLALEGTVPWHSSKSLEDVFDRKERTNMQQVCSAAGLPELAEIISICRSAERKSEPPYDDFARLLGLLGAKKAATKKSAMGTKVESSETEIKPPSPRKRPVAAAKASPTVSASVLESVYLTVLRQPQSVSLAIPVAASSRGAEMSVGREPEDAKDRHLVVEGDEFISENHMNIRAITKRTKGEVSTEVSIQDTSRNGVKVDGVKIGSGWVSVAFGSVIKIGCTELRVDAEPVVPAMSAGGVVKGKAKGKNGKSKDTPIEQDEVAAPLKRAKKHKAT